MLKRFELRRTDTMLSPYDFRSDILVVKLNLRPAHGDFPSNRFLGLQEVSETDILRLKNLLRIDYVSKPAPSIAAHMTNNHTLKT